MKKLALGLILASMTISANAADERAVGNIVKKYSETVACQIVETEYQKNQYKTVRVQPGFDSPNGMGAIFVTYWEGDFGCMGGSGTVVPNFTVAAQQGFESVSPVVIPDFEFPALEMVSLSSMSFDKGALLIKGVTYGPNDTQHSPKKSVSYRLKFKDGAFVKL